jgi:hypothetical protein
MPTQAQKKGRGFSSKPFATSALERGGTTTRQLYPKERTGTDRTGDCVGLRAGLDEHETSRFPPEIDPEPSSL